MLMYKLSAPDAVILTIFYAALPQAWPEAHAH